MKPLVSVCIPAYDESDVIDELTRRLAAVADRLAAEIDCEFIICENGSLDDTYAKLLRARERDPRIKIVRLTRNFRAEGGVTAALAHARGDCAVIMNADLQDPPEYIGLLLEKWRAGYEHVYCIVSKRTGESRLRRFLANRYYWLLNCVSEAPTPQSVSDFRLVDRAMYETYLRMPERLRVMRSMWSWMGFRSIGIATERPARAGGTSKFRYVATFFDAMRHIFAQSRAPLIVMPAFGLALAALSFALFIGNIARVFVYGVPFDGFGTIVALLLLLFGSLFVFLWMMAEYIGMIFEQVRYRPTFIVDRTNGLEGRHPVDISAASARSGVDTSAGRNFGDEARDEIDLGVS